MCLWKSNASPSRNSPAARRAAAGRRCSRLSCCCSSLPLCAQDAVQQPEVDRGRPLKSTTGAVLRSLAVPGWGQYYTKNYWKAAAFARRRRRHHLGHQLPERPHDNLQAQRGELRKGGPNIRRSRRANVSAASNITAATTATNCSGGWRESTLLSMGDAYVDAQLYGVDMSPSLSLEHGTVGVTVSCKF